MSDTVRSESVGSSGEYSPSRCLRAAFFIGAPWTLLTLFGAPHAAPLGITLSTVLLWVTEVIPLPVTALLIPLLSILLGVSTVKQAFAPFGNEILALFLGCFLLSEAMQKHGFDKRLAYVLLTRFAVNLTGRSLCVLLTVTSFVLSMWISNTAATIMIVAIIVGFLGSIEARIDGQETIRSLRLRLFLGAAFGASMGGIATPIGSPPNLIAIEQLSRLGVSVTFTEWLLLVAPLAVLTLLLLLVLFEFRFPLPHLDLAWAQGEFKAALGERGPLSSAERVVGSVFALAVILWIVPDAVGSIFPDTAVIQTLKTRCSLGTVGLIAGLLLFLIPHRGRRGWQPTLEWDDAAAIEWGTILLFGGGLALGEMLERTGAAAALGGAIVGLGVSNPLVLLLLFVLMSIIISEFASNTAAAALLIPLIVGFLKSLEHLHGSEFAFILSATVGASFGFMLPVSTPPNAIIYSTGHIPVRELMRTGLIFDLLGLLLTAAYFAVLSRLM